MELIMVFTLVVITTTLILNLNRILERIPISVNKLAYINTQFKFQTSLLLIALTVLATLYVIDQANFMTYFAVGSIVAPAQKVFILGIADGESWLRVGLGFSLVITLVTLGFIFLSFRRFINGFKYLLPFMGWVLLFSLSNSFAEEVIYRLGVIIPLAGTVKPNYILFISAIAFGIPHFRGMPNGITGVLLAGFLGWLLAKSVLETQGIFWAWLIHFFQDIVIISAFVMAELMKSCLPEKEIQ